MLAAIIDNGSTWLLNVKDNIEISTEELANEWKSRYVGWMVNTDNISDIMDAMPISRYLLKKSNGELIDINIKTAHYIYEEIPNLRNKQTKTTKK